MKKLALALILFAAFLYGGLANAQAPGTAQCSDLNEPGSMLVFPLIDNVNFSTIIEITNRADTDVWLQCYAIWELPRLEKKNFYIHLTQREPFWWETRFPYNRTDDDGRLTQIQGFPGHKGFIFCWAIDGDKTQQEIDWDFLKGDALLYTVAAGVPQRSWQYNAIPQQALAITQDRVLRLDGVEYTAGPATIYFEGFAENFQGIGGTLAVANMDFDFVLSTQSRFDINVECWNQHEVPFSRHLYFPTPPPSGLRWNFAQYDLTEDLQLSLADVFTPKFECATSSTNPLWAVFYEFTGGYAWGGNVFQTNAGCVPTAVVLPAVPIGD